MNQLTLQITTKNKQNLQKTNEKKEIVRPNLNPINAKKQPNVQKEQKITQEEIMLKNDNDLNMGY